MINHIRRVINCILALALLFGLTKLLLSERENHRSQKDYDQAIQIAGAQPTDEPEETVQTEPAAVSTEENTVPPETRSSLPEDPVIQDLMNIDLEALRRENGDVIGWICIPDTKINYPLLQRTDNDFYLKHTWKRSSNASGAIFMNYQNRPDFSEFNTIIYGHNMRNGTMFASLHSYRRPHYWEEHPYIYIVNDAGVMRFNIFSAQSVSTKSIIYGLGIETEPQKEEFLRFALNGSCFQSDIIPSAENHFLTLSTCTGAGHTNRWVVLSVLNEEASVQRPE